VAHAGLLLKEGILTKLVSEQPGYAAVGITVNTTPAARVPRRLPPGLQEKVARKLDQALRAAEGS
jgi:hypothetical protein